MKSNGLDLILNKYDLICGLSVFPYCKRILLFRQKNYSNFIEHNLKYLKHWLKLTCFRFQVIVVISIIIRFKEKTDLKSGVPQYLKGEPIFSFSATSSGSN